MPTILVVDDEPMLRTLVCGALQPLGAEIVQVENGTEALESVRRHRPDLIILDWMMPGISGLEVVQTLRSEPATADIAVLILSSRGSAEDRAVMEDLGVSEYMTKPFSPVLLRATVRKLLPESPDDAGDPAAGEP